VNIMGGPGPGRVLVMGDDMRVFLAVVRSLGRAGHEVHAAPFDSNSPSLKSKYIAKVHHLPSYTASASAWRAALSEVLRKESFDLVVPTCDRAIIPLHMHRDDFAEWRVAIPHASAMDLLLDKEQTRRLCTELGIPVAAGRRLEAGDSAEELADRFGLPLIVKPRQSYWIDRLEAWGRVSIVESVSQLRDLLGSLQEPWRYLVESRFDGVGVGVSVLSHNGVILQAFQHRRLREGSTTSSSYRVSEPLDEELYRACEKICGHTRLTGVCMFEFRWNPNSRKWILIETNARFWGSSPLPISLGVDFPRFLYDLLVHDVRHPRADYEAGIRARNFVLDGYNLLCDARRLRPAEIGTWLVNVADFLVHPLRWPTGRERSDSFVSDDLRPALWECAAPLAMLARKLTRGRPAKASQPRVQTA
jgi:predicted ATP-grasp superfamily ATP-dependent carboligase